MKRTVNQSTFPINSAVFIPPRSHVKLHLSSFQQTIHTLFQQRFIRVSILSALFVWGVCLATIGPVEVMSNIATNWQIAVTMIFGSIVAGGTSMGGGAVAFPVMTKVLHVSPSEAMIFSLAIQSIGMGAASLVIIAMGTKVEWRFIRWASLGGIPGIFLGSGLLANVLPSDTIRLFFTMLVASFAFALLLLNPGTSQRNSAISSWGTPARMIALIAGCIGGMLSGVMGSGMDIFCFSIMVLLFGLCESISTPTSVILMAINAVIGFCFHAGIGNFIEPVTHYWLAAIPVVVVGAPVGAIVCSRLKRKSIVRILIGLSLIEVISSIVLIPLNISLICFSAFVFILFCSIYFWMHQALAFLRA